MLVYLLWEASGLSKVYPASHPMTGIGYPELAEKPEDGEWVY